MIPLLLLAACAAEDPLDGARDGTWTGDFSLDVSEATTGSPSDSCAGTATLVVRQDSSPSLSGTASCSFSGELAEALPGEHPAQISGELLEGDLVEGDVELDVSGNIIVDDWSGSLTAEDRMVSEVEGSFALGGSDWDYLGGFDVVRAD